MRLESIDKKTLENLKNSGYKYIVKLKDVYLSGWGVAEGKRKIWLIPCTSWEEVDNLKVYAKEKKEGFAYFNYYYTSNYKNILALIHKKDVIYTVSLDWKVGLADIPEKAKKKREKAAEAFSKIKGGKKDV